MKKLILTLSFLLYTQNSVFAVDLPNVMKQTMSHETGMPSLLNLVVSMILVIGLIYVTGWIYTKLNQINRDKLNRFNVKDSAANKFKILHSMPLGQQRHVYSVEINGKVLIIGSTPSHINLLKEFDSVCRNEVQSKSSYVEKEQEDNSDAVKEIKKSLDIDELYKKYKN